MAIKKYFIAIVLPEPVLGKIEAIKQQLFADYNLKGALRSPAHITLHRPFEWKEEKEAFLIETLKNFRFNVQFELVLKDFAFFEPRVVYVDVLQNDLLFELHTALKNFAKKELRLFNEVEDKRGFHPHVTVAFRDLKKPVFYELKGKFENEQLLENFEYNGFSLLKLEARWQVHQTFTLA